MADSRRVVVLDTNVLVSALLNPLGPPAQILGLTLIGELAAAHDPRLLDEYREVLRRQEFGFSRRRVAEVLDALERDGLPATARPLLARLPDPADEPFLEVAAAARAWLVTGNMRHFPPGKRGGVVVLTPRELLERLRRP
jgi:putative PIN family toxin of toxin-antitoxin system